MKYFLYVFNNRSHIQFIYISSSKIKENTLDLNYEPYGLSNWKVWGFQIRSYGPVYLKRKKQHETSFNLKIAILDLDKLLLSMAMENNDIYLGRKKDKMVY